MFPLGVSVTVNINHSYVFIGVELGMCEAYVHVCVCDRTRGMRVRGELWSVARIKTTATETCTLPSLHS